jgi:hypothetical protein
LSRTCERCRQPGAAVIAPGLSRRGRSSPSG